MKKLLNLTICAILTFIFFSLSCVIAYAVEMDGFGTEDAPYLIKNEEQLLAILNDEYSASAYYRLENDIELITRSWVPIGALSENGFSGNFDGNNHKIINLTIGSATNSHENIGFFSENTGTISNLTIEVSSIIGNKFTGVIAGSNKGTIKNCDVSGLVSADNPYNEETSLGGITGNNFGTIANCSSSVIIKNGNAKTGGIAGYSEGEISKCEFNGIAKDLDTIYFGGIAGYTKGNITNCSNTGTINTYLRYLGGIAGYSESGLITFCSSVSNITSTTAYDSYIGGLIGLNKGAEIENSYSIGNITCLNTSRYNTYVGGFIGYNESENYIKTSYCSGKVIGKTASTFSNGTSSLYTNCFYNKTVQDTAENWVFGLSETDMKDISNQNKNYTFWDFNSVWGMNKDINDGYPYLLSHIEPVTGITVSETALTLALGETIKIEAEVVPKNATNKTYTWASSDKNTALVDTNGVITAKGIGSAIITAKSNDGNFTAACKITVTANTSLNETLIFKVDDFSTVKGQKVSVPVRLLTGNSTGISSLSVDIRYSDTYLKPIADSFKNGNLFSDINFSVDTVNKVIHITAKSNENTIGAGILCYLEFKTAGSFNRDVSSKLIMTVRELKAISGTNVKNLKSSAYEGIITINNIMYGDLDGNNSVTAADAALLLEKSLNSDFRFPIETEDK
ncbi:MAG: hypothetical protein HFE59_07245 [Clostridiales bacterium]|nr:hypothetical protein [Clostridiales bacterium]